MIIKEYLLNSSIHGLNFIADRKFHWSERLFWTICVIASWVSSFMLMLTTMREYQTQDITFIVDTSYLRWVTNFPSIVVCEKSNDVASKFENEVSNLSLRMEVAKEIAFFTGHFANKNNCKKGLASRKYCLKGNYTYWAKVLKSECPDLFSSCYYNNVEFPCCEEFLPIDSFHGVCFAVNSIVPGHRVRENLPFKIVRDINIGLGNLSVEIYNDQVEIFALSEDSVPSYNNAMYILANSDDSNTKVKPNRNINIYMNIKEIGTEESARNVDIAMRDCRFQDENNLRTSRTYSMPACHNECLIEAQKAMCNCILHTLSKSEPELECDLDGLLCLIDSKPEILKYINNYCNCVSSCFEMEIDVIGVKFEKIKAHEFRNSKSVVRLNFITYPPSVKYTRTVVKTPLDMIVSLGGTASLFVGASLLTIVEIIYYLLIRPQGDRYVKNRDRKQLERKKLGYKNTHLKLYWKRKSHFPLLPYID